MVDPQDNPVELVEAKVVQCGILDLQIADKLVARPGPLEGSVIESDAVRHIGLRARAVIGQTG